MYNQKHGDNQCPHLYNNTAYKIANVGLNGIVLHIKKKDCHHFDTKTLHKNIV